LALNFLVVTARDFYLWGSLTDKVYITNPTKKGHPPRDFPNFRARTQ